MRMMGGGYQGCLFVQRLTYLLNIVHINTASSKPETLFHSKGTA